MLKLGGCVAYRLGDHVPGSGPFWDEVQRRGEGPILALLKHKPTGRIILAGKLTLKTFALKCCS